MSSFLKVSFFSACLTLFKMLMGFVIAKVIAIYTGPSGMALLGQLQSFVTGVNGIVNAPVGNGIVKYTAEHCDKGSDICSQWWKPAIAFSFSFSIILSIIAIPFSNEISYLLLNSTEYNYLIIITLINLPFTAFGTLIMSITNGQRNYKLYILYGFISTLIASAIMLVMLIRFGIIGALLSTSLQYGLIGIVLIGLSYRKKWFQRKYFFQRFHKAEVKDILAYVSMALTSALSLPFTLIIIRSILINYTDISVAGQWQAVWKISEAYIGVVTIALSTYFLPKLSSLNNVIDIKCEIRMVLKHILPFVIFFAVVIFFMRDFIIALLFTSEFSFARDLFLVQLLGDVIKIISWVYAFTMLSTKATLWYIGTEVFFCLSWIFASYIFIH
ncbi:O-antigen translocase, partial [Salmonella enterica subsp. enterica serovar Cotham]|nr:O-antigen translocase [Salmonella enterica subsp. enterica serovar Cotham]